MADEAELAFVARMRDEASEVARRARRVIDSVGGDADPIYQEYKVRTDEAGGMLKRLRGDSDDANDGLGDVAEGMTKVLGTAANVGPAVLAVGSALSAAAAGAVALGGAVGPAAVAGIAAYAGTLLAVKTATFAVTQATAGMGEAIGGDAEAMKELSPPARELAKSLKSLTPEIKGVRETLQTAMFDGWGESVQRVAKSYLPLLDTAARQTGNAIGDLGKRGAAMVNTGPWKRDFAAIASSNAQNIGLFGDAGLSLADALRNLLAASMPLVTRFAQWAKGAAGAFAAFVEGKRQTGELAAFFDRAGDAASQLGGILGDVAAAVGNVFGIAARTSGQGMLDSLEKGAQSLRDWTNSAGGIKSITGYFRQGQENLSAIGRLIRDAAVGFSSIGVGSSFPGLIDKLRLEVLPHLIDLLNNANIAGTLPALVDALGSVVEVFANLAANDGSTRAFADTLKAVADAVVFLQESVPGANAVMGTFFTIMGAGLALKLTGITALTRSIVGVGGAGVTAYGHTANLVSGFRSADSAAAATTGKMGTLGGNLKSAGTAAVNAAKGAATWAATNVKAAATATASMVSAAGKQIATWAALGAASLKNAAKVALAWVISMGPILLVIAAVVALAIVIYKNWDKIKAFILKAAAAIKAGLSRAWGAIKGAAVKAWNAVKSGILRVWNAIKSGVSRAVNAVKSVISKVFGAIKAVILAYLNAYRTVITTVWNAIRNIVTKAINGVKSIISRVMNGIKSFLSNAWNAIRNGVVNAWNRIKSAVSEGISRVLGFVKALPGKIKSALGNLGSLLFNAGKDIIQGLLNGISNLAGKVYDKLREIGGKAKDAISGALKIFSPSRVMRDDVGRMIPLGVAEGIVGETRTVENAALAMARAVTDAAAPTLGDLAASARAASFRSLGVTRSTETITVRHEVVSPDGSLDGLTAEQIADLLARDPKAARALEQALRPARAKVTSRTISASD